MSIPRPLLSIAAVSLVALPGVAVALANMHLTAPMTALIAGAAIMSAAFLLVWACDAAQSDVSQSLALAAVALIAILPEYAVDMYFTWQAGKFPESDYSHYAIANMTGANRLIIGVAWVAIVAVTWLKSRRGVVMEQERRLEIRFLAAATIYAMIIPIKGSLVWYDGVVFIGMYLWYMILAGKRPAGDCECEGPGAYVAALPQTSRRIATVLLFLFAAGVIVTNAERFCEGLVGTGKAFGIDEFLLVQWLAPLASEAPEFVVAIMFALRGRGGLALGSLVSAKLNQWTLLVGMIPGVYAVSSGTLAHPIPMGSFQMQEILLTAAQSLLAVVMLSTLRLSVGQGFLLFALFTGQLVAPALTEALTGGQVMGLHGEQMHVVFSFLYLAAAFTLIVDNPRKILAMWKPGSADPPPEGLCHDCGVALESPVAESCPVGGPSSAE